LRRRGHAAAVEKKMGRVLQAIVLDEIRRRHAELGVAETIQVSFADANLYLRSQSKFHWLTAT
jgi:hypothetical protein